MNKRTKIVCTIGPASNSTATLKKMIKAGMNVCRLNFSHGTYKDHKKLITNIRRASRETGVVVSILQDLSGPKIRVGDIHKAGIKLSQGKTVTLSSKENNKKAIPVRYPRLEKDVKKGEHILLDDGLLELEVVSVSKTGLTCKVLVGGLLKPHKGVNLPFSKLSVSSITRKDKEDLKFGLENKVDFVALSFVRQASDIKELQRMILRGWKKKNGRPPQVIAKIEKSEALKDLVNIVKAVDCIMVARGDLGIETPAAEVPVHQKKIINLCRTLGKPVIVATEMLGSMVAKPRPTRAEVSDVANAVIDHADAVMLSGESATGQYPVEAVLTMARIAQETEESVFDDISACATPDLKVKTHRQVGALMSVLAQRGDVRAILIPPESTGLVNQIAYFRPELPVIVGCIDDEEARQINLIWGTRVLDAHVSTHESFVRIIKKHSKSFGLKQSDAVAMVLKSTTGYQLTVGSLKQLR